MLRSSLFFTVAIVFFLPLAIARAEHLKTHIHHLGSSTEGGVTLVMLGNGRVAIIPATDKATQSAISHYQKTREEVEIILNSDHQLISLVPTGSDSKILIPEEITPSFSYEPSKVTETEAQEMFRRMRTDNQRNSQCYNRAHVWAYEEWKRSNLNLMKIFVFYTERYIRDYRFYWWFHAVPGVYVGNDLIALDREFASSPLSLKDWTDIFVESLRPCPIISKYSTYENNQQTEHCYIHPATMYFWQPRDLETLEQTGEQKTEFIPAEIRHAYWEAF